VSGAALLLRDPPVTQDARGERVQADQEYWWIRDYGAKNESTYVPPRADDYNPVQGWHQSAAPPRVLGEPIVHDLGFVPGVWIRNMRGTDSTQGADGLGTWEKAKDTSIEIDYLLSQASRGVRYNCAPQLVLVGQLVGGSDLERSPVDYIHLSAGVKQESGESFGEGKALLLEMTGEGIKSAQDQVDKLRNMALEQIGYTRKDPEKLKGVMSGRAMEFLDEDSHDTIMELRSSYGAGALELMRKIVRAIGSSGDPKGIVLDWPRLYQPTPEDLAHLIPALVLAVTPVQEPLEEKEEASLGSEGGGAQIKTANTKTDKKASGASTTTKTEVTKGPGTAGGRPSSSATGGKIIGSLLEMEEGSQFLKMYMDIDLLPDSEEAGVSDSDEPQEPKSDPDSDLPQLDGSTVARTSALDNMGE
jgi:hypothetical protein